MIPEALGRQVKVAPETLCAAVDNTLRVNVDCAVESLETVVESDCSALALVKTDAAALALASLIVDRALGDAVSLTLALDVVNKVTTAVAVCGQVTTEEGVDAALTRELNETTAAAVASLLSVSVIVEVRGDDGSLDALALRVATETLGNEVRVPSVPLADVEGERETESTPLEDSDTRAERVAVSCAEPE